MDTAAQCCGDKIVGVRVEDCLDHLAAVTERLYHSVLAEDVPDFDCVVP
jgi:hypothetical protein